MGCMKSKQTFPFPTALENEKRHASEETFMPEERCQPRMPSPAVGDNTKVLPEPSAVVVGYAHHLSQEILQDALKQWACNNIKYCDIPYIENEGP